MRPATGKQYSVCRGHVQTSTISIIRRTKQVFFESFTLVERSQVLLLPESSIPRIQELALFGNWSDANSRKLQSTVPNTVFAKWRGVTSETYGVLSRELRVLLFHQGFFPLFSGYLNVL